MGDLRGGGKTEGKPHLQSLPIGACEILVVGNPRHTTACTSEVAVSLVLDYPYCCFLLSNTIGQCLSTRSWLSVAGKHCYHRLSAPSLSLSPFPRQDPGAVVGSFFQRTSLYLFGGSHNPPRHHPCHDHLP